MRQITPEELKERLERGDALHLLDVREAEEHAFVHLEGSQLVPLGELSTRFAEIDPELETVVYCHHGIRSMHAIGFLEREDYEHLWNLSGGIEAYAERCDPSLPRY